MASSRGRERAQQRGPRVFVFGSSTPRDLSHMNKIPKQLRQYNVKIVKESQESPSLTISDYMKKARSLTRNSQSVERQWAFGSCTPRDLAHLTNLKPSQRRYDAVIPKKSATTPNFVATPIKRSSTVAPASRQTERARPDMQKNEQIDRLVKDDEVSSEPDFVQDRGTFLDELKEIASRQEAEKKIESAKMVHEDHFEQPTEIGSEMTQSQVIPPNIHEAESVHTVSHQPVQPVLQDQMLVADLTHQHEEAMDPVEIASQKVGELMQDLTPTESGENKTLQE